MVKYSIRWKDCDKSAAVISHIEQKISKFEDFKFIEPEAKLEIVRYEKDKSYKTRINLLIKSAPTIRSEASAQDLLTSINMATDKTIDQLRRIKTQKSK